MSKARHTGKIVLTIPPRRWAAAGTVLVTGGTGTLGGLVARHLADRHGVRDLVLVSAGAGRGPGRGPAGRGAGGAGAAVRVAACDAADRAALAEVLAGVPVDRPLAGVVHAPGCWTTG